MPHIFPERLHQQRQGLAAEYDRLLSEHDKLRRNFEQATGGRAATSSKFE